MTLPITKHNYFVTKVEELADTIREAFLIAKSGRPGPVLIDIPKDVQLAKFDYEAQPIAEKTPLPKVKECKIDETSYGVFEKTGIDALAMLLGYAVRKNDAEPEFIDYLTSWIADINGKIEDCKMSILKKRERDKGVHGNGSMENIICA